MSGIHAEAAVLVYPGTLSGTFGIVDAELTLSIVNTDGDFEWNPAPITPCGDVSGDGLDDLLTGPTEYRSVETHGALLIDGVPPAGPARGVARAEWVEPAEDWGSYGRFATVVGDVSGDGIPDVAMSGIHAEAAVLVYPGTLSGTFGIVDAELTLSIVNTDGDFEWNPAPITPCGDVSGDGLDDLCAGDRVFWGPVPPAVDETHADVAFLNPSRPVGYGFRDLEPVDMDADGVHELVLAMTAVDRIDDPRS